MKAKIGTKIMLGYIVVLMITFVLTVILSTITLRTLLRRDDKKELVSQGQAIVKVIEQQNINRLEKINRFALYKSLLNMDEVTDADIYILAIKGKILYQSSEGMTKKELTQLRVSRNQIFSKTPIISPQGDTLAQLILVSDLNQNQKITGTTQFSIAVSLGAAMIFALIIAYGLQRSITKPLKRLTREVQQGGLENARLTPIRTGDEIEEFYQVFQSMLQKLSKSAQARKTFFQNTSHELKSPLMSIQGYAEAIKDGVVEGEDVDKSLNIIIQKSQALKKTVEDVIYLSKLENADITYSFERVRFHEVISMWVADYTTWLSQSGLKIRYFNSCEEAFVHIDVTSFKSVITNILDNALRYAKQDIKIEVSQQAGKLIVKIIDDGAGFEAGMESNIFERFYKGEGGKSGLGLAIAKNIVEGHGGTIKANNMVEGGAGFEIGMKVG